MGGVWLYYHHRVLALTSLSEKGWTKTVHSQSSCGNTVRYCVGQYSVHTGSLCVIDRSSVHTLPLWDKTAHSPSVGESNVDRYSPVQSSGGQCWPGSRYSIVRECLCAERQKQGSSLNLVNF